MKTASLTRRCLALCAVITLGASVFLQSAHADNAPRIDALHVAKVYPSEKLTDALALLASSYRLVISIAGAYLTAKLAPQRPMKHALILGGVGVVLGLVGVARRKAAYLGAIPMATA